MLNSALTIVAQRASARLERQCFEFGPDIGKPQGLSDTPLLQNPSSGPGLEELAYFMARLVRVREPVCRHVRLPPLPRRRVVARGKLRRAGRPEEGDVHVSVIQRPPAVDIEDRRFGDRPPQFARRVRQEHGECHLPRRRVPVSEDGGGVRSSKIGLDDDGQVAAPGRRGERLRHVVPKDGAGFLFGQPGRATGHQQRGNHAGEHEHLHRTPSACSRRLRIKDRKDKLPVWFWVLPGQ
jgi:hypothetical protein